MTKRPQIIAFPSPATAPSALRIEGVHLRRADVPVLDGVSLSLQATGISGLIGPNGAGKSVLLRVIAGLIEPDLGEIALPLPMRGRIGLVAQRPVLLRRSVRGNLNHALRLARVPRHQRADRLQELLTLGHLETLADRPARQVSGGEAQRLAIVRALAAHPALLLLDEPTAHLDPRAVQAVEKLITEIALAGTKILLVTHDTGQLSRLAREVAFMHRGRAHEVTPMPAFLHRPQSAEARAYLDGSILL